MFNNDKHLLKLGINGHLAVPRASRKKKLIPPGARSVDSTRNLLENQGGEIILQSGIRVFHGFFRQIEQKGITFNECLGQERDYYRIPPFSSLGEHTHFLWQADNC